MREQIPSAGPWITDKEIAYVNDAVRNGWYANWDGYIRRFEEAMAKWVGRKYALSTSSCTGALHIAMAALGIGPGDEVVVPETTWLASVTCVKYVGATAVFVDVERDTWCLDPQAFERAITPRTRAVIPVHMYGHPADMVAIEAIAKAHGIAVVEDAAPGIGSTLDGRLAGSFGIAAAFSFQGAKPLATGEGGMLVTDDDAFFDKAHWYGDHCRDSEKLLYNTGIGFKYKMSNLQAALGLAQLERADEIIAKRRQIFFWYQERLGGLDGLSLNAEREGVSNSFYVPTIVLDGEFRVDAEGLMRELTRRGIGNRPFFRAISKLPMFEPAATPVADHLARNGVNLPCPSDLTEQEADHVARAIREILLG